MNTREKLLQRIFSAAKSINKAVVLRKVTSSLVTQKIYPSRWRTLQTTCLNVELVNLLTVRLTTYLNKRTVLLLPF